MAAVHVEYEGKLRTRCVLNGKEIVTDAPKEVRGLGEMFSPTDLLAASLGSCILTMMGIYAEKLKVDLSGTTVVVEKEMLPQRVKKMKVVVKCPRRFEPDVIKRLQDAAEGCPVHHSLHPDVQQELIFHWGEA